MPKSEQKKFKKFRICPICRTSNSGFLSWLRNYSCQYEFRQFNEVLSMLEESWYIPACGLCFEFFEAKFTESKSNLSLVFVPAGLQRHSPESAFKWLAVPECFQMGLK